jgi:cytochrome c1
MRAAWLMAAGFVLATGTLCGCMGGQQTRAYSVAIPGNPHHGRQLIVSYGCGSCHTIPGIYQARGVVGPPLYFFGRRTMIAGELPNTPDNLVRWLRNPQDVEPGTAMPVLGLNQDQAQDIAAYLDELQ